MTRVISFRAHEHPLERRLPAAVPPARHSDRTASHRLRWVLGIELMLLAAVLLGMTGLRQLSQHWANSIASSGLGPDRDALNIAIGQGDAIAVHALLHKGHDVNALDADGLTPLVLAALWNRADICELLIDHGADVNRPSDLGTALYAAASQNAAVAKLLLSRGADPNIGSGPTKVSPLMGACLLGPPEAPWMLIEAGADVNACGADGFTPLMCAAIKGPPQVVQLLLDAGADVTAMDDEGKTALHYALEECSKDGEEEVVVQLLLDAEEASAVCFLDERERQGIGIEP